ANINAQAQNKDTPWLLAGARGQTRILQAMLNTGKVDYSIRNRFGGNALIPACERGHVETVRLLVTKSKIDVNHINNLGWTALMEAVLFGDDGPNNLEIVRLLVKAGADVNIADKSGITPLAHARLRRLNLVSQFLASNGGR
ncbi:MAG: ankyrin repeat domain-containing protein, partial [Beijerinckiaceae bacterium]